MDPPAKTAEPNTSRRRRFGAFDAIGVLAIAAFVAALWLDRAGLSRPVGEVSLQVDPEALAAGFREGVSWHGLYRGGDKVGFSRTERRRRSNGGFQTSQTMVLPVPGLSGTQAIEIVTELDDTFSLASFTASVRGGPLPLRATGAWQPGGLHLVVEGLPGGPQDTVLALDEPPQMDQSFAPLATRAGLSPGDRFSFTHFDPLTSSPAQSIVEVVGTESIDVLGEPVQALRLRQQLAGESLDVWVNDLGEILRQTLPGGLLAVRESEAQATWGVTSPR